ncbi:flagellar hook protein FlgE [Azohydromonas caseinilytica]|uniref:Flagellar hook protein FlgE n=1 Tax=Azohydromonas caseinilytica TaxID=2728836 RepID=A0A848F818_9BURK|nr:flagellar hook protein FlgE [Azohydromonas caseinilytica]NML14906.1 flagellar hook protein FlgE [Azohydromonas caseinilytica]
MSSFQQGLSGLNASSKNLEVIGNNIANAGTYGAKTSRAEFSHMYTSALGSAVMTQVGAGVSVDTVSQQFTQGNISDTGVPTDLAISGEGFFQVSDGVNPVMYTRNGQFKVNDNGEIVNNDGLNLLGYPANATGQIVPGALQALRLPTAPLAARATTEITLAGNLKSGATAVPAATTFDPTDPSTYTNATSQTIYDAKGEAVSLNYYFRKTPVANEWDVYLTANGQKFDGAAGTGQLGTMTFTADGTAVASTSWPAVTAATPLTIAAVPASGTTPATMQIDLSKFDLSGFRQQSSSFSVNDPVQDGYAPGSLSGVSFQADGTVLAQYTNGKSLAVGQLELAKFRNPQGLQPMSGNLWAAAPAAGDPVRGVPGNGVVGKLRASALEESNVDIANELVNMITAQRAYQANAQTIKTQDQIMQTLVNLR